MKEMIKKIPVIGPLAERLNRRLSTWRRPFPGSQEYWIHRYDSGGDSGAGSYGRFAEFKAEIVNNFVRANQVSTVIEYGCGDGNQLKFAEYQAYIGFDVSPAAISMCEETFSKDRNKLFKLINQYDGERAELTLSLDVIYHLTEDDVFIHHMERLFDSSERFVIIYSSNEDATTEEQAAHVRHREFTKWVEVNRPGWRLIRHIPNRFSNSFDELLPDFYVYEKSKGADSSNTHRFGATALPVP